MRYFFASCLLCIVLSISAQANNYTTPGTGVNWTLNDLVTNSGGDVSISEGGYFINDTITISFNDTLTIVTDETVKFAGATYLQVNGIIIINPPIGVLFTAQDQSLGYHGMRLDSSSGSIINKLTFEYGNSLRLFDCSPTFDQCIFRYNSPLTNFGNAALSLFRANPVITNSQFIQNKRAAISGGANINNAPKIIGCLFSANNTLNLNLPQINMGSTGVDTAQIINCQIIGGNTNSGGIGFLPTGTVNVFIKQNFIKSNRYGITLNGGANINALISYNRIDDNNIQNDPNLGGSGIAFSGGTSTSHQNSIVTGNVFTGNLWGITVFRQDAGGNPISGAMPNLGNLNNADTTDDGKNRFINNTNSNTPGIDLYNNSSDPIFAMGNYWNTNIETEVEGKIFHQPDNAALGLVTFSSFILPIHLLSFTAKSQNNDILLQWRTSRETNSHYFAIEKSYNGQTFVEVSKVAAAGNSNTVLNYAFKDALVNSYSGNVYYRIKMTDTDGKYQYSPVAVVTLKPTTVTSITKFYPTVISEGQQVFTEMLSPKNQPLNIRYFDDSGKLLGFASQPLITGYNRIKLMIPAGIASGWLVIKFSAEAFSESIPLLKQ